MIKDQEAFSTAAEVRIKEDLDIPDLLSKSRTIHTVIQVVLFPARLRVLETVSKHDPGRGSGVLISKIELDINLCRSTVFKHLKFLDSVGLVRKAGYKKGFNITPKGKMVLNRVIPATSPRVISFFSDAEHATGLSIGMQSYI